MTFLGIQNAEKMGKFDPHHQVQGEQHLHRFVCKDNLIRGDVIVKQVNSIFMDTPLKESIRILFDDILDNGTMSPPLKMSTSKLLKLQGYEKSKLLKLFHAHS